MYTCRKYINIIHTYIHTYMHTYIGAFKCTYIRTYTYIHHRNNAAANLLSAHRSSSGDDGSMGELGGCECFADAAADLLQLGGPIILGDAVDLVQHDDHGVGGDLPYHYALGRLGLDALVRVDHENDHVYDLGPTDDRADKGSMAGAIHQGKLETKNPHHMNSISDYYGIM